MGQVSVRTLRHYEEIGLLQPVEIDQWSGYRYYSTSQLPRLNRILRLKDVGLSLEQIGQMLEPDFRPEQLKAMLKQKQAEAHEQLKEIETLLSRVESWLNQLERGSEMTIPTNYEITLKKVEPILVASLRQAMSAYGNLGIPFGVLRSYLKQFGFVKHRPSLVLWHFPDTVPNLDEEDNFEVELIEQLDQAVPSSDQIKVYNLPPLQLSASVIHRGSLDLAYQAYQALGSWVETHGYKASGPIRQIHHEFNPGHDPSTYITEFQMPVEKHSTQAE